MTVEFTLNGGETYTVEISIINDTIEEFPNTENFTATLTLLGSNVAVTLDPDTAYVTIIDDDGMYTHHCRHSVMRRHSAANSVPYTLQSQWRQ